MKPNHLTPLFKSTVGLKFGAILGSYPSQGASNDHHHHHPETIMVLFKEAADNITITLAEDLAPSLHDHQTTPV